MAKRQVRMTRHRDDMPKEPSFSERAKLGQLIRLEKLGEKLTEIAEHIHDENCNHE